MVDSLPCPRVENHTILCVKARKHTYNLFVPPPPSLFLSFSLSPLHPPPSGDLKSAIQLFEDALQMFVQVYGPLHVDIANCYRHLAKLSYILSSSVNALAYQHKATLIFERVLGVDHSETLSAYINLALYCHNTGQTATALRLLYR